MTPVALEKEDHRRDAAFNKTLHGNSSQARGGLVAMRNKDAEAQKAAVDEYFKHWDKKLSAEETDEIRKVKLLPTMASQQTMLMEQLGAKK
jgi:sterol 24-C-methyltransferase